MTKRFLAILASVTVLSAAVFAGPASSASRPTYQKLPTADVTLKKRSGYYVECHYSGLGEVCEYVYARVKGSAPGAKAKLQRIKVNESKLKRKSGYYVECHYSGLGEVCEYVYAKPKP